MGDNDPGTYGLQGAHHGARWLQGAWQRPIEMTLRNQYVEGRRPFFF